MSTIQRTFAGTCCIDHHRNHRNASLNHHRAGAKAKRMKKEGRRITSPKFGSNVILMIC